MVWDEKEIERITCERLIAQLGEKEGDARYTRYKTARNNLCKDVYPHIEKYGSDGLTDHSAQHISNVLDNVYQLLGEKAGIEKHKGLDLYCLLLAVLFHDVGNIFGRDNHQKKIGEAYDKALTHAGRDRSEWLILQKLVDSHCGVAIDGTKDTINGLSRGTAYNIDGNLVSMGDIAAVLRFADELAEGPQRTSDFISQHLALPKDSEIYHQYANSVNYCIDKRNKRVVLTCSISVGSNMKSIDEFDEDFKTLMRFIVERIEKLNDERRYNRFYSDWLEPFKRLEITINIEDDSKYKRHLGEIILPEINDKVIPDSQKGHLKNQHPQYDESKILEAILERVNMGS